MNFHFISFYFILYDIFRDELCVEPEPWLGGMKHTKNTVIPKISIIHVISGYTEKIPDVNCSETSSIAQRHYFPVYDITTKREIGVKSVMKYKPFQKNNEMGLCIKTTCTCNMRYGII